MAGRISYFAPVSLLFFFFVLFVMTTVRGIELHPMNYFFLAGAFFSFHLLMAYLVDHISIHIAFVVCSAISIFPLVSYLRLVAGMRRAALEEGLAQFVFLVLFFSTPSFSRGSRMLRDHHRRPPKHYEARIPDALEFAVSRRVLLARRQSGVGLDIALGALPFEEAVVSRSSLFAYAPGNAPFVRARPRTS